MARSVFRIAFVLLLAFAVTACAAVRRNLEADRAPVYDVRDVRVFANAPGAMGLIAGVDRRVSDAIAVTMRGQMAPPVVLMLRIDRAAFGLGEGRDRNEADISLDVVSVESGTVIANGSFRSVGYGLSPVMSQEALAEIVAARIRYLFSLDAPPVGRPSMPRFPEAPRRDYIESPEPVAPSEPRPPAARPAAAAAGGDFIAPSIQAKIDAAEAGRVVKDETGLPKTVPVPTPAPTPIPVQTPALTPAIATGAPVEAMPAKATGKPVSAKSDVEGGAKGRITLKPAAAATAGCAEGTATPCPPVPQP